MRTVTTLKDISIHKHNREAVSVCEAFVDYKLHANILFIQGYSGAGKTTLLQCLTHDLQQKLEWNTTIVNTEEIAASLTQAIQKPGFSHQLYAEQFMDHDVLILDDFDCLVDRTDVQRELAIVLKHVLHSGRNIVIASRSTSNYFPHMFTSKGFKEVKITKPPFGELNEEKKTA